MAKPDKAQITYDVNGTESILRFHSVISEEHEVSTEITKFPTQAGFVVSNTAIKKNRRITISGIVSNTVLETALEDYQYSTSTNNSRWMFDALRVLVRNAVPCKVLTNLGTYEPVIFNRFKTKQAAGMTDAMTFTIMGEETQIGGGINSTTPTPLIFTPLSVEEREAKVEELLKAGVIVEDQEISVARLAMGESFVIDTINNSGEPIQVTYEFSNYDAATGKYNYVVHTTDTAVHSAEPTGSFNMIAMLKEEAELPSVGLLAGVATASACLVDSSEGLAKGIASETINTAIGELTESVYGAIEDNFGFTTGSEYGDLLVGLAIDCCVVGAIGSIDPDLNLDNFQDSDLTTVDDVLNQAASKGDESVSGGLSVITPTTLTKISGGTGRTPFLGDLI